MSDERVAATVTSRDNTIGRGLFDVFADANPENPEASGVAKLRASLDTVLATRAPHRMAVQRYDLQHPDGGWEVRYWAPRNVPVIAPDGAVRYIVHQVLDITDVVLEREAVAAAERREAELRAVLESMGDGVYFGSANGITLMNRAALLQHGYARREEFPSSIGNLAYEQQIRDAATGAPIAEDRQPFVRALAGERVVQDLLIRHRVTGEDRVLRIVAAPVVVAGIAIAAIAVSTDITDEMHARHEAQELFAASEQARADAEAARREAEAANLAKSEFLAVMSHELRTPLNAIGGYAGLMEIGIHGPVTPAQRVALDRIQQSQRALLSVINDVLNYTRLEAGAVPYDLTDVRVAEAVGAAEVLIAPQLRAKGMTYRWDGCDPALAVRADRDKLQQVLLNLLSNAIKFTQPRDGDRRRIDVSCAVGPDESTGGERVMIRVRDTGIGIPADKLDAVFEPFVQVNQQLTREQSGTGLSLAISRDLARGMGGDLTAQSEFGNGSTFTLSLPSAAQQRM